MFQPNKKFENILSEMLDRIPDEFDKREGSVIYDALAPAAMEIESLYYALDVVMTETYAETASRENLIKRAREKGIIPYPAVKSIVKGQFNVKIKNGIRFQTPSGIRFEVLKPINEDEFLYELLCEAAGEVGNISSSNLIQIDFVEGLNKAEILSIIRLGTEEEDTELFRQRYLNSFKELSFGGNKAEYKEKTLAIPGVGAVKITPVWNGGGTVKITVLDTAFNKANDILLQKIQQEFDPTQDGTGVGIAPIGHIVTVDTPNELNVSVQVDIRFTNNITFENRKSEIEKVVIDYLNSEKRNWSKHNIILRTVVLSSKLLNIANVEDIITLRFNNKNGNLVLNENEIPKFLEVGTI